MDTERDTVHGCKYKIAPTCPKCGTVMERDNIQSVVKLSRLMLTMKLCSVGASIPPDAFLEMSDWFDFDVYVCKPCKTCHMRTTPWERGIDY